MSGQVAQAKISTNTQTQVTTIFQNHTAGLISPDDLFSQTATAINAGNAKATTAADLSVAREKTIQTGEPTLPLGLRSIDEQDRLTQNARVIYYKRLAGGDLPLTDVQASQEARLQRLARAEPLKAGQDATQKAMQEQGAVGWIRVTHHGACKLCVGWADGVVRSVDIPMNRHIGCACSQQVVFKRKKFAALSALPTLAKVGLAVGAAVAAVPVAEFSAETVLRVLAGSSSELISGAARPVYAQLLNFREERLLNQFTSLLDRLKLDQPLGDSSLLFRRLYAKALKMTRIEEAIVPLEELDRAIALKKEALRIAQEEHIASVKKYRLRALAESMARHPAGGVRSFNIAVQEEMAAMTQEVLNQDTTMEALVEEAKNASALSAENVSQQLKDLLNLQLARRSLFSLFR